MTAAKALGAGNTFSLNDIKETGKKRLKELNTEKRKKEHNAAKQSDRVKEQLRKLGRDV